MSPTFLLKASALRPTHPGQGMGEGQVAYKGWGRPPPEAARRLHSVGNSSRKSLKKPQKKGSSYANSAVSKQWPGHTYGRNQCLLLLGQGCCLYMGPCMLRVHQLPSTLPSAAIQSHPSSPLILSLRICNTPTVSTNHRTRDQSPPPRYTPPQPPCVTFRLVAVSLWGRTVTRSSLRMLRRVAAFCRPLRPVLLLMLFSRSRSPVVGVLGL